MVGTSADHANTYPVAFIPSGISIDNIDTIPGVEVVNGTLAVDAPNLEIELAREILRCGAAEPHPPRRARIRADRV
jgi:hypothetical protein